jgi:hypothetical protein
MSLLQILIKIMLEIIQVKKDIVLSNIKVFNHKNINHYKHKIQIFNFLNVILLHFTLIIKIKLIK